MRALLAGLAYFGLVFGTGFVLGAIRVTAVVPHLGERWAELLEMPLMAVVIVVAARWIVRWFSLTVVRSAIAGGVALLVTVSAEWLLAVVISGQPLGEYLAARDPISGSVYAALLIVFAVMPSVVARRRALPAQ